MSTNIRLSRKVAKEMENVAQAIAGATGAARQAEIDKYIADGTIVECIVDHEDAVKTVLLIKHKPEGAFFNHVVNANP